MKSFSLRSIKYLISILFVITIANAQVIVNEFNGTIGPQSSGTVFPSEAGSIADGVVFGSGIRVISNEDTGDLGYYSVSSTSSGVRFGTWGSTMPNHNVQGTIRITWRPNRNSSDPISAPDQIFIAGTPFINDNQVPIHIYYRWRCNDVSIGGFCYHIIDESRDYRIQGVYTTGQNALPFVKGDLVKVSFIWNINGIDDLPDYLPGIKPKFAVVASVNDGPNVYLPLYNGRSPGNDFHIFPPKIDTAPFDVGYYPHDFNNRMDGAFYRIEVYNEDVVPTLPAPVPELSIVKSSHQEVPNLIGTNIYHQILVRNTGSAKLNNIDIIDYYPDFYVDYNANHPLSTPNDGITPKPADPDLIYFNNINLEVGETTNIVLVGTVKNDGSVLPNNIITNDVSAYCPKLGSTFPERFRFATDIRMVMGSWDPNEKIANPSGIIKAGESITYCIWYENLGNIPTSKIVVEEVLPPELDPRSITPPSFYEISDGGVYMPLRGKITWTITEPLGPGETDFVYFTVKAKADLEPGTEIINIAKIVFDNNPAIYTPPVTNIIGTEEELLAKDCLGELRLLPLKLRSLLDVRNINGYVAKASEANISVDEALALYENSQDSEADEKILEAMNQLKALLNMISGRNHHCHNHGHHKGHDNNGHHNGNGGNCHNQGNNGLSGEEAEYFTELIKEIIADLSDIFGVLPKENGHHNCQDDHSSNEPRLLTVSDRHLFDGRPVNISYIVDEEGEVSLNIIDKKGTLIKMLVSSSQPSGSYSIEWDGLDSADQAIKNGPYFVVYSLNGEIINSKIIIVTGK